MFVHLRKKIGIMKLKVAIVGTRTPKLSYSEWEKLLAISEARRMKKNVVVKKI